MVARRALILKGVTRRFGTVWVLRGIDARFESGSIAVVGGANGAGKSTLMSIVGGLARPSGGEMHWEVEGSTVGVRAAEIGWVGHESSCYRDLTASENVALVASVHGAEPGAVGAALERVGIGAYSSRRVGTLSRGQRQRVALARGIVHGPALLLLDEPYTGLDIGGCELLDAVLREERRRGAIVLVVSHDSGLAERLDASTVSVHRGRVTQGGRIGSDAAPLGQVPNRQEGGFGERSRVGENCKNRGNIE